MIAPHVEYIHLLNDVMELQLSSLSTLVPEMTLGVASSLI